VLVCLPSWSLGVIFDPKLAFKNHASAVCKACNSHLESATYLKSAASRFCQEALGTCIQRCQFQTGLLQLGSVWQSKLNECKTSKSTKK